MSADSPVRGLLLQGPVISPLIHRVMGSAPLERHWRKRVSAVAAALLIFLVVGAMGPHLVHHLFDTNHEQACVLSAQASLFPGLTPAGPSIVLAQALEVWTPALPLLPPQILFTGSSLPRVPPSTRA